MPVADSIKISDSILDDVEAMWIKRCKGVSCPLTGIKYSTSEIEFFIGALAMMNALDKSLIIPPRWITRVMSGRRIIELNRFD